MIEYRGEVNQSPTLVLAPAPSLNQMLTLEHMPCRSSRVTSLTGGSRAITRTAAIIVRFRLISSQFAPLKFVSRRFPRV